VNVENDTQEVPIGESEDRRASQLEPDLGPWGPEAVPLGKDERDRRPTDDATRRAEAKARRWVPFAAMACAISLIAVLGANILSGDSGFQTDGQEATKTRRQPPGAERKDNRARAARQAEEQRQRRVRRQARRRSRRHSVSSSHPTPPAPSPTYAPVPEPAPAPEPVAPSPAPAPAPTATPTTKPPPASGPTVAKEFGFER
jgi:hypothetical protein